MKLTNLLGYTGLLPFILLPLLYQQQLWLSAADALQLYMLYSALILGFMAGVLWPALQSSQQQHKSEMHALIAVTFPVLSFIALMFAREYFFAAQACLFVLLRMAEYRLGYNRQYSVAYRRLRNRLTLIVLASHLMFYYIASLSR